MSDEMDEGWMTDEIACTLEPQPMTFELTTHVTLISKVPIKAGTGIIIASIQQRTSASIVAGCCTTQV